MANNKKIAVIIVAGGRGSRASANSSNIPKQYKKIAGIPVLTRTINQFLGMDNISYILPVIHADDKALYAELLLSDKRLMDTISGGKTRQLSVFEGLKSLESLDPDYVLIHDAARPFVNEKVVDGVIHALKNDRAVIPATNVIDSIKRSTDGRTIGGSEDREQLYAAQTPQGFHYKTIFEAHKKAINFSDGFSDDAAIAEWEQIPVALSIGSTDNVKITNPSDFARAERFLGNIMIMETRVGSAYDVHQFEKGNEVILGGIKIPHDAKLKGHSDADAALHVLTDAILGALSDGDIGTHFPPSDKRWKGEPSTTFLKFATKRLLDRKGHINHLDLTLICEAPKITPHTHKMRQSIANICEISIDRVSVKATTSEKMGFIGRKEGLAAMAVATIELERGNDV